MERFPDPKHNTSPLDKGQPESNGLSLFTARKIDPRLVDVSAKEVLDFLVEHSDTEGIFRKEHSNIEPLTAIYHKKRGSGELGFPTSFPLSFERYAKNGQPGMIFFNVDAPILIEKKAKR